MRAGETGSRLPACAGNPRQQFEPTSIAGMGRARHATRGHGGSSAAAARIGPRSIAAACALGTEPA